MTAELPVVLIVDDVVENVELLAGALEDVCEVQFALSGEAALQRVAEGAPDLVLLDVMMPGLDGFATLRRLRELPGGADVPVILVTGDVRLETQLAGLEAGASDFLTKPVELPILKQRARNLLALHRSLGEQRRLVDSLRVANAEISRLLQFQHTLLSQAGQGILAFDLEGRCTYVNPEGEALFGYSAAELLGVDLCARVTCRIDGGQGTAEDVMREVLAHGVRREMEALALRKDGEEQPIHVTVTPMTRDGVRIGAEVICLDVRERRLQDRHLRHLASTDPLTDADNRRTLLQRAEEHLAELRRGGPPVALWMLDLDHFKAVNDVHGHGTGDAVLRAFARDVRAGLRDGERLGRLGGEEFAVLLPGVGPEEARSRAEAVVARVAELRVPGPRGDVCVTVSVGVTALHGADAGLEAAFARADQALYRAKTEGRGRARAVA